MFGRRILTNGLFAAEVIAETDAPHFSDYLIELLEDINPLIVERAIIASGNLLDPRSHQYPGEKTRHYVATGNQHDQSLRHFGEAALYELDTEDSLLPRRPGRKKTTL